MNKFLFRNTIITLSIVITVLSSCKNNTNTTTNHEINNVDSTAVVQKETPQISIDQEVPNKSYSFVAWPIKTSDSLKKKFKEFSEEEMKVIETINRTDKRHLPGIDTILIPSSFGEIISFSPFPLGLDILKPINKFVFFSYPIQAFGVYENGKLVKWGPTNMGKKATPTPTGLFFANWKGKEIRSSVNKSWILKWNFNIHNTGGVGWHEYELPGYPASHSCLRLLASDAKWLYDWADQWIIENQQLVAQGTPTIVSGEYPWGARKPWKNLIEDVNQNDYTVSEMNEIIQPNLEKMLDKQQQRIEVIENRNASQPKVDSSTNI